MGSGYILKVELTLPVGCESNRGVKETPMLWAWTTRGFVLPVHWNGEDRSLGGSPGFSFEHVRTELPIRYLRGKRPTGFLGLELREDILAGDTEWESSADGGCWKPVSWVSNQGGSVDRKEEWPRGLWAWGVPALRRWGDEKRASRKDLTRSNQQSRRKMRWVYCLGS